MSDPIFFLDTTLRVSEPSPGVSLTLRDKLHWAAELAATGVDVIEAGYPAASSDDHDTVRQLAANIRSCRIGALARCVSDEIDAAGDALRKAAEGRLHVYIARGDLDLSGPPVSLRARAIELAKAGVTAARAYASDIQFSVEDTTRVDFECVAAAVRAALEAGATTINLTDSGHALPDEIAALIARLRGAVPETEGAILSFHGHDDLGLATANALAAVGAGARQLEVTVNGIGDGFGHTSFGEVVSTLGTCGDRLGVATHIDVRRLFGLSAIVRQRTTTEAHISSSAEGADHSQKKGRRRTRVLA